MTPSHPSQKTVRLSALQPGDLIFSDQDFGGHVEMYGGNAIFPNTSFQAVVDHRKDISRVMATSLRTKVANGEEDDHKVVFRCRRPDLAGKAVKQARLWAAYENRYDDPRCMVKRIHYSTAESQGIVGQRRLAQMVELFNQRGRFRAIKYTARRDTILCYPGEVEGWGRGVNCAMWMILVWQAAGLDDYVRTLPNSLIRVSDKKISREGFTRLLEILKQNGLSDFDVQSYRRYLDSLHEIVPYELDLSIEPWEREILDRRPGAKISGITYQPSLLFWKGGSLSSFDFAAKMTPALLLDAKIAKATDFEESIRADITHWEYLGVLSEEPVTHSRAEKNAYQTAIAQREEQGVRLRAPFMRPK